MKPTRITVSVIVALNIASAARAQETLKGEVVAIDRASKKISITLGGTVRKEKKPLRRRLKFRMLGCSTP